MGMCLHCATTFRQWERVWKTGAGPGRERSVFLNPRAACWRAPCRQGDAQATTGAGALPTELNFAPCAGPAESKAHVLALSSCLFLPLGLSSFLFQVVTWCISQGGKKIPEGSPLLLDPSLDGQKTRGTIVVRSSGLVCWHLALGLGLPISCRATSWQGWETTKLLTWSDSRSFSKFSSNCAFSSLWAVFSSGEDRQVWHC